MFLLSSGAAFIIIILFLFYFFDMGSHEVLAGLELDM